MIDLTKQFTNAAPDDALAMSPAQLAAGVAARFDGLAAAAPVPGMDRNAAPGGMA